MLAPPARDHYGDQARAHCRPASVPRILAAKEREISQDPQENREKAPDGQSLREALDACAKIQSDMVLGRASQGGPEGRPTTGFAPVAGLFALSALMSVAGMHGFLMAGGVTALGLDIWRGATRSRAVAVILAAAGLGFLGGDPAAGVVVASALAIGVAYGRLMRILPGEDDHFYLIPALMWALCFATAGIAFAAGGDVARRVCIEWVRNAGAYLQEGGGEILRSSIAPGDEPTGLMKWVAVQIVPLHIGALLGMQATLSFLAVKWARARWGWGPPLGVGVLLFRVGRRYSMLLVVSLVMLILAPDVERVNLTAVALAMMLWFGSGCFLAGLGCSGYTIAVLRASGQTALAWICTGGLIFMLVAFPIWIVFMAIGLVDIWFNVRRLPEKEA